MKEKIIKAIQQVLAEFDLSDVVVELEHPMDERFGDWSTNVALQYHQQVEQVGGAKPLAELLQSKLADLLKDDQDIEAVTVAGGGFINFKLSDHYWLSQLNQFVSQPVAKLIPQLGSGKKVIVEYSSPNIAKPFTVGHLRSTIIGDAIANLYQALGWQVYRDNHLGDWGTQFGKLIYAIKTWGDKQTINNSERPIKELVNLYVKFHEEAKKDDQLNDHGREWFKKLEAGDAEARELWQWCVDLSWQEFDKIYAELGTKFTENEGRGYGESYFEKMMPEVLEILTTKLPQDQAEANGGYYGEGEDGAKLVFFNQTALPSLMIMKQDGATLYATRDLATDYFRLKNYQQPDLVINEVGAEQSLYFRQLYQIEELLGWYQPGQRVHVKHGLYRFKDQKMSTRGGNVIWLEEVIEEAKKRALALANDNQSSADLVAIGALKWNDLKSEAKRDIVFNWDEILNMKGNSGPYVQYAAVRANSVLNKATDQLKTIEEYIFSPAEQALISWLARFPEVVAQAAVEFAPHHLALFLFELAQRFNLFYTKHSILEAETADLKQARLALTQATQAVLTQGLSLLGIKTPEEM